MGSEHRVLFQNAENNINMGAYFNDPDFELYDIYWYVVLAEQMQTYLRSESKGNKKLLTANQELKTTSCYVELHRNGESKIN